MFTKKYHFSAARGAFSYITDIINIHTQRTHTTHSIQMIESQA